MLYCTAEEYKMLGGQYDVTNADLFIQQLGFDGLLFPNSRMINQYYQEHGTYTAEVKLAMVQYTDYQITNNGVLSKVPKQRAIVGTTGVAYGPSYGENFGNSKYYFPPLLRTTLKGTNLLSPNYTMSVMNGKPLKLWGTPWAAVNPLVAGTESSNTVTPYQQYNVTTFAIEDVFEDIPTLPCEVYRAIADNVADTMIEKIDVRYESLGTCRIQYEDLTSTEQTRGYSIVPGKFNDGTPTIIKINDMIKVQTPTGPIERVVEEIHSFFESNSIHHHRILLS